MSPEPLTFGSSSWLPTRLYADGYTAFSRERWTRYLAAYRERASDLYRELLAGHPAEFAQFAPVDLVVVVSLVREWVFTRPASGGIDTITVDEQWEDPVLADWNMTKRPDAEQIVRQIAGISADFTLLCEEDMHGRVGLHAAPVADSANPEFFARDQADLDASGALSAPTWARIADELRGRVIDREELVALQDRFDTLSTLAPRPRGTAFEAWLADVLRAHDCKVERGLTHGGEQIDLFVHQPFRAIIETRWAAQPLQYRAVSDLAGKLARRPAIVAGIYVSMSGFTDNCRALVSQEPNGRTVLLWTSEDVAKLLSGEAHAMDLYDGHVNDLVRRYRPGG